MQRSHMLRVLMRNGSTYERTPIPTLDDILLVAKFQHQLVQGLGVLITLEACLVRIRGESEAWQRGSYNVESRVVEGSQDLLDLGERARPAMDEQQRYTIGPRGFGVDEM